MITVDKYLEKLEKSGKPVRVGLVGAGFAGRVFAMQVITSMVGMRLVAISNRTKSYGEQAYKESGIKDFVFTNDPMLLCKSKDIDIIVDATYDTEFGAQVALEAFKNKKHLAIINAEMDSTIGPILKVYADKAGVIYTQADGDQPGVLMNLYREVKGLGFKPVMAGNIKSLIDPRRTPETQKAFAESHFQRPTMITSFADGTKICVEMATVANATGFKIGKRGMY